MTEIKYVTGNLFEALPKDVPVLIFHCCNNIGAWGAGFVIPLERAYPTTRSEYLRWHSEGSDWKRSNIPFALGQTQVVEVAKQIFVANCIGQEGVANSGNRSPVRYEALEAGIQKVADIIKHVNSQSLFKKKMQIHSPKFGAGLAGGDWNVIEELIRKHWLAADFDVTIYSL